MSGKGAPEGNTYAKKDRPGRTIGLYITSEELDILENLLVQKGQPTNKLDIDKFARQLFKKAIRREENE